MIHLKISPMLFGVPNPLPEIRGFKMVAQPDSFLIAQQGGKEFVVESFPTRYRLLPFERGAASGCLVVRLDRAINIPKD